MINRFRLIALVAAVLMLALAWGLGARSVQRKWDLAEAVRKSDEMRLAVAAERQAREKERRQAERLAEIETRYEQEKKDALADRDRTITELRSGQRRLYVNVQAPAGAGGASPAGTGPGTAEARAELSQQDGEFLVRLAAEADDVVRELNYCVDRAGLLPEPGR